MNRRLFIAAGFIGSLALLPDSAAAQVVQLPTYRVFQMPLNVVVPDRGIAFAGGTSAARDVRSTRGGWWPSSDFRSSSRAANSVHVAATIIDHRELDAAVLAQARAMQARPQPQVLQQRAAGMKRQILAEAEARRAAQQPIARQRSGRQREIARRNDEAQALIEQGDTSLSKGHTGAARIFYRTALRQSHGQTHLVAQHRLSNLNTRRP